MLVHAPRAAILSAHAGSSTPAQHGLAPAVTMCLTALVNVYRLVRWAWTLAGVWFACIVGIVLSFHGFVTTKRNTAKAAAPTSTGLGGSTTPGITAIIPTHNEEGTITKTISHLIKHTKVRGAGSDTSSPRHFVLTPRMVPSRSIKRRW